MEPRQTWQEIDWQKAEQRLLLALKAGGLGGQALVTASKVPKHAIYKVTARLLKAKKIVRTPGGKRKGFTLAQRKESDG
jgi:hypothetical protein